MLNWMNKVKSYFVFSNFQFAAPESEDIKTQTEYDPLFKMPIYDKLAHLTRDFFICSCLSCILCIWIKRTDAIAIGFLLTIWFMVIWEIKDGFLHYLHAPSDIPKWARWWYGDGFSLTDIVAGIAGTLLSVFIHQFLYTKKVSVGVTWLCLCIITGLLHGINLWLSCCNDIDQT